MFHFFTSSKIVLIVGQTFYFGFENILSFIVNFNLINHHWNINCCSTAHSSIKLIKYWANASLLCSKENILNLLSLFCCCTQQHTHLLVNIVAYNQFKDRSKINCVTSAITFCVTTYLFIMFLNGLLKVWYYYYVCWYALRYAKIHLIKLPIFRGYPPIIVIITKWWKEKKRASQMKRIRLRTMFRSTGTGSNGTKQLFSMNYYYYFIYMFVVIW